MAHLQIANRNLLVSQVLGSRVQEGKERIGDSMMGSTGSNTNSLRVEPDTSKALSIGIVMQVNVGNVNASWKEGIVTVIKKVERPNGDFHPYISGQALRRYIRDTIKDILDKKDDKLKMSPENPGVEEKSPVITEGDPRKYIDDDLFGFMRAVKRPKSKKNKQAKDKQIDNKENVANKMERSNPQENTGPEENKQQQEEEELVTGTKKRTSPLRVSPAFGIFKLNSDRDLGTRSAVEVQQSADAGGAFFETEITNNLFRTALLLELDRVGIWKRYETTEENYKDDDQLNEEERKKRISILLESLKYLYGGGRQSTLLVNLTPQFIIYARMRRKVPLFLNSIDIEYNDVGKYKIKTDILKETVDDYSKDIQSLIIGVRKGQFTNSDVELKLTENAAATTVTTVGKAIDMMISDVANATLPLKDKKSPESKTT